MKKAKNLFEQIISDENLEAAYIGASKHKHYYKEVKEFEKNKKELLNKLKQSLIDGTYKTSSYTKTIKKEGNKLRIIYKLPFYPDRIAQYAIIKVLEPYFIKNFIYDTYSAIPKRGGGLGIKRIKGAIKDEENTKYVLKLDIKHY